MCPAFRESDTPLMAVTPPNRFTTRSTTRMGSIRGWAPSDGARQVVFLLEHAEDAPRHEEDHRDDDGAEEELVEIDEARPDHLLEGEEEHGAQHGAPDRPLPPEEDHHDHGNGHDEREDGDGLDVAL